MPVKNISHVETPAGKMKVDLSAEAQRAQAEMEFGNIKVNKGMSDKEFVID